MLHIWDAQIIWLSRLQGQSLASFPSKSFQGNVNSVLEGLVRQSSEFSTYLEGQNEAFFAGMISYSTTSGTTYQQIAGELLLHCFNHSTYHRGQIITIAHQMNWNDFPATDYIFYLRRAKQE